jgi:hypothetical protein
MTDARRWFGAKARLAVRVWADFALVHLYLRRWPLPEAVTRLGGGKAESGWPREPVQLGRIIARLLTVGRVEARCLTRSLVLFRQLRRSGLPAELVIGIPRVAETTDAHAWVELFGKDVGPPPGRGQHAELARYS